ncbi:MAG: PAS domain S-box protein, partial [Planctomycetota bacterium]
MKKLRDFVGTHQGVLLNALQLATCGFYLRRLGFPLETESRPLEPRDEHLQPRDEHLQPCDDKATPGILISHQFFYSLGLPTQENAISADQWRGMFHPDDWPTADAVYRQADQASLAPSQRSDGSTSPLGQPLLGLGHTQITYRLRRGDGSYRYTAESGQIIQPDNDGVCYWLGVLADVDQQHRFESELESSERRFRELFTRSPSGMLLVDADACIRVANSAAETIFGYGPGEMEGQPIENLVPQARRLRHAQHRKRFENERVNRRMGEGHEFPGVRRDGREVIVEVALTRLQLDGDDLILASVVDVSARVEARNRLRWAVDVGQVGFWELDFVAATGASETLLLQQLGMDQPWTNISEFLAEVHPDDVEPLRESFTKFLASDDTLHE